MQYPASARACEIGVALAIAYNDTALNTAVEQHVRKHGACLSAQLALLFAIFYQIVCFLLFLQTDHEL